MASRRQPPLLDPGARAPGFRLRRLEGGEAALAEWTARGPVLVVFFKVTCPVCQLTLPFLERLHAAGTLAICGISQSSARDTGEFNTYYGVTFPTLFLVEPGGQIGKVTEGWSKMEMEALGAAAGMTLFRAEDDVPAWKAG